MSFAAAVKWFFKVLKEGEPAPVVPPPPPPAPAPEFRVSPEPALQVLALLQKEGRLLDFLMEDISSASDSEIGAAARAVHAGCRRVLAERFQPAPILTEAEGAQATLPEGFDASAIQLSGRVSGSGPRKGEVRHRGWRAQASALPTIAPGADPKVLAPAQVEIG